MSKIKILRGIPHCHSNISSGSHCPQDIIKYFKRDKLDFLFITDHFNKIDKSRYNYLKRDISKNKKYSSSIIPGFEFNSFLGHLNIISKNYLKGNLKSSKDISTFLDKNSINLVTLNHPSKKILKINYSKEIDNLIDLIEVGNGTVNYKDYEYIYKNLLDSGFHIGAINGQDNHKLNFKNFNNVTAIFILNKHDNFISSMKKMQTFSMNSRTLNALFFASDNFIGSTIPKNIEHDIYIKASDKNNFIENVSIITKLGPLFNKKYNKEKKIEERFKIFLHEDLKYMYLKITHKNGTSSISSPIFIE